MYMYSYILEETVHQMFSLRKAKPKTNAGARQVNSHRSGSRFAMAPTWHLPRVLFQLSQHTLRMRAWPSVPLTSVCLLRCKALQLTALAFHRWWP